jgi:hypothetical protein
MEDLKKNTDTKRPSNRVTSWHGPGIARDNERYQKARRTLEAEGVSQIQVPQKIEVKISNRRTRTVAVSHKIKKS